MSYNWNWGIFFQLSPDGTYTYLQLLLFGAGWTLATALLAWVIALSVGAIVGVIRTAPVPWLVRLGNAYVELFRNIPLLVQMFLWYFVLPEVMPQAIGDWLKQSSNASFYNAVICLGLYTSARVAEQVKAGILSLRSGQRMAGLAMGLTLPQTYRYVLLPMAFRIILPPLSSEFLNIIKNSSVALTIGLIELTARGALDVGIFLSGVRGLHRRDPDLHRHQHRRRHRHALARTARRGARLHQHGPAGGGALRANDVRQFRLGRHHPLAAVPVPRRHALHHHADLDGDRGRHRDRHAAGAGAAVEHSRPFPCRGRLREPDPLDAARSGDLLVLLPGALHRPMDHGRVAADPGRRIPLGAGDLHAVRGRLFLRDHARRHPVDPARPGAGGAGARHELLDQRWARSSCRRPSATWCRCC